MSYGIKYRLRFDDHFANTWRVELLFNNFSGSITALKGSGDPIHIRCETTENLRENPIKAKSAELEIISETFQQYSDIFEANAADVQMKIYKEETLQFHGTVLPDEYSEPLLNGRYKVKILAVDGISLLKNKTYVPQYEKIVAGDFVLTNKDKDEDVRFCGFVSVMSVIRTCISQISYGLDYKIIDGSIFYESTTSEASTSLRQIFVNRALFRSGETYLDCYSALKLALSSLFCRITQAYNADEGLCWHIECITSLKASFTAWVVNGDGSDGGTVTINNSVTVTSATGSPLNVFTDHSANVEIDNAPGKIKIVNTFSDENIIKDTYDFTARTNWLNPYTIDQEDGELLIKPQLNYSGFDGITFNLGWAKTTEDIEVTFNFKGDCHVEIGIVMYNPDYANIISYKAGTGWVYASSFEALYTSNATTKETQYKGTLVPLLHEGGLDGATIEGRLVLIVRATTYGFPVHLGDLTVYLNSLKVTVRNMDNAIVPKRTAEIVNNLGLINKEVSLDLADSNPRQSIHIIGIPSYSFANTIMVDTGTRMEFAYSWNLKGSTETYSFINLVLQMYDEIYSQNRFRISGSLLGQMDLISILIANSRLFIVDSWDFAVKSARHTVVLMEIDKTLMVLADEEDVLIISEDGSNYIEV
jgi:hypothetical protein